jgi:hypothetical protein
MLMYYNPSFEQFRVGFATTPAGRTAPEFAYWSRPGTLVWANSANSINQYVRINRPATTVVSDCAWASSPAGLRS